MRPCLNLMTLLKADLEEALRDASAAGFKAVEISAEPLESYLDSHSHDDLRSLVERYGLDVVSVGDVESITFCNLTQLAELHDRCSRLAAAANAISCKTLVVSASVRPRGTEASQVADETASALEQLLDVTAPEGVRLALAFRGFPWCSVNSLEGARQAVESISDKRVGLVIDTFDLHATGVEPETISAIDPSQVFLMRLSDCADIPGPILLDTHRLLPGEGVAKLDEMVAAAKSAGYQGPVSLKILSPRLLDVPPDELAKILMAIVNQYVPDSNKEEQALQ